MFCVLFYFLWWLENNTRIVKGRGGLIFKKKINFYFEIDPHSGKGSRIFETSKQKDFLKIKIKFKSERKDKWKR